MSKTPRLSKSGIEYLDHTWNFYSGCENWKRGICGGGGQQFRCWAKSFTERFPDHYPNGFEPTFYPEAFLSPMRLKKPSRIGVAWMGDLFGDWVDPDEEIQVPLFELSRGTLSSAATIKQTVFGVIRSCPQHDFLFLTKCSWNLWKWSPFPENAWVGVTATGHTMFHEAIRYLREIEAKIKFISVEPLLEHISVKDWHISQVLDWLTIGAQTQPYRPPQIEHVEEIVRAADKARILVFLKDNLFSLINSVDMFNYRNLWSGGRENKLDFPLRLRQEMPREEV